MERLQNEFGGEMNRVAGAFAIGAVMVAAAALAQPAPTPQPTAQDRVGMLKAWLAQSQAQLRNYQWVETTVVAKSGEEKSRKIENCYYGVDGALVKVPIENDKSSEPRGPLMHHIAEKKKEELTQYMDDAAALVHTYIPPVPELIAATEQAGNFALNIVDPGHTVRLEFKSYHKNGDMLSVDIDLPTNRLLGVHVASYLDSPDDAVQLDSTMGVLPDGTLYVAKSVLYAQAKDVTVTVENNGYRRNGE